MSKENKGLPAQEIIGDRMLCAWRVAYGVVRVQTRDPKHFSRLSSRSDSKLVGYGVAGGYLKLFDFAGKDMAWARRLIGRYTGQTATTTPIPA